MPGSAGRWPAPHVITQSRKPTSGRHYPKVQNGALIRSRQYVSPAR